MIPYSCDFRNFDSFLVVFLTFYLLLVGCRSRKPIVNYLPKEVAVVFIITKTSKIDKNR